MTDLEALHLLWLVPAVIVGCLVLLPASALVYAGMRLARYDDKEIYLHG